MKFYKFENWMQEQFFKVPLLNVILRFFFTYSFYLSAIFTFFSLSVLITFYKFENWINLKIQEQFFEVQFLNAILCFHVYLLFLFIRHLIIYCSQAEFLLSMFLRILFLAFILFSEVPPLQKFQLMKEFHETFYLQML